MFARTFSFWRRLVGKTPLPDPADVPQADRRLWVRYPADLATQVQLAADEAKEHRVSARVRDISVGGANLLVDCAFEAGKLISLELPQGGDKGMQTVLACVVRATKHKEGQWALGCVFARELTDEDLQDFGALRVRLPASDKRTWKRFATNLKTRFQKIGDPENRTYTAQVLNLSASGVGLSVLAAIDAGALLSVDLVATGGKVVRTILACVVHVTKQTTGEYALGCNFIRELGEEDLKALI